MSRPTNSSKRSFIALSINKQRRRFFISFFLSFLCILMEYFPVINLQKGRLTSIFFPNLVIVIYGFGISTIHLSSILTLIVFLLFCKNRQLYIKNSLFVEQILFIRKIIVNIALNFIFCCFLQSEIPISWSNLYVYVFLLFGNMIMVLLDQISNKYGMFSPMGPWHIFCIVKTINNFSNYIFVFIFIIISLIIFKLPTQICLWKAAKEKSIHIVNINNIHEYYLEDIATNLISNRFTLIGVYTFIDIFLSFVKIMPYETSIELQKRNLFTIKLKDNIYKQLCIKIVISCFISSLYMLLSYMIGDFVQCIAVTHIARDWNVICDFVCSIYRIVKIELL